MGKKRAGPVCGTPDGRSAMYCPRCGEAFPFPIGAIEWVVGVVKAFDKVHRTCKAGDGHIRTGLMPLAGVCDGVPLEREKRVEAAHG